MSKKAIKKRVPRRRPSPPKALQRELAERVKELKCLHTLSALFDDHRTSLEEILQKVTDSLPSAWQYPDQACARITLKNRTYVTAGFREPKWKQQGKIMVANDHAGIVEVGYAQAPNGVSEPRFLKEEGILISTIAERISEIIALRETRHQVLTYQEHLRSLASELTLTEERERHQLALILHDRIGQGLAVTKLKLETLRHTLPPEHQGKLQDIFSLVKQILEDTRSLTFEISPPVLYELGFSEAIAWLANHFQKQFGIHIDVAPVADGAIFLSESVRVMLFRSVQELLTNVIKHAQASRVEIGLRKSNGQIQVSVEDNGVGFDMEASSRYPSATGGFGLFSIRERMEHLGGHASVESAPGKGTRVLLSAPSVITGD